MRILYIEPYDTGSHAMFTRVLTATPGIDWTVLRMPGRHWKWRMRGSAAYLAPAAQEASAHPFDLVFASAFLPLAEFLGLVPALAHTPSVLYFHENQAAYPWQRAPVDRDLHYAFTQIVSSLAASHCVFNSAYNRDSFLEAGAAQLAKMPDAAIPDWRNAVQQKSSVLGVPLEFRDGAPPLPSPPAGERAAGPVILWNHRWEFDKNPDAFFAVLRRLASRGLPFRVTVCGQQFSRAPPVFERARAELGDRVVHFGTATERADYVALLDRADIAVSTAFHEFFGVAMLEAAHHGAHVLVPNRLAYPEHFCSPHLYETDEDLERELERLIGTYVAGTNLRADRRAVGTPYTAASLIPRFLALFDRLTTPVGALRRG